jgi:hypothetical protein
LEIASYAASSSSSLFAPCKEHNSWMITISTSRQSWKKLFQFLRDRHMDMKTHRISQNCTTSELPPPMAPKRSVFVIGIEWKGTPMSRGNGRPWKQGITPAVPLA